MREIKNSTKKIIEDYKKYRDISKVAKINSRTYQSIYQVLYRYKIIKTKKEPMETKILNKTAHNTFITNIPITLLNRANIRANKLKLDFKPLNGKLLIEVYKYE